VVWYVPCHLCFVFASAPWQTVPAGDTVAEEQQQALKKKKNGCDGMI
jgi:hypothetical protein